MAMALENNLRAKYSCRRMPQTVVALICTLLISCGGQREKDALAVKAAYTELRDCLLKQDFVTATNYISTNDLHIHPDRESLLKDISPIFTNVDFGTGRGLSSEARVRFENQNKAFLFPGPMPAALGFAKENNHWKYDRTGYVIQD